MDLEEAFVAEDMQDRNILFVLIRTFLLILLQDVFEKLFEILTIMKSNDDSNVIPAGHSFYDLLKYTECICRIRVDLFLLCFEKLKLRRWLNDLLLLH